MTTQPTVVALSVRRRMVTFEAPQCEHRALQHVRHVVSRELAAARTALSDASGGMRGGVWIHDPRVFALTAFLLSEDGARTHPLDHAALLHATVDAVLARTRSTAARARELTPQIHCEDPLGSYTVATTQMAKSPSDVCKTTSALVVLVVYRPEPLLPLCWPSARRAVRFVNAVVSLVTANAYISTLGGGHFLCRHLNQAKVLAQLQIAVSVGLQDPVLESKCRVNLAYGALQAGRFRRALRIIERESVVAAQLESDELARICHAARVYLLKTYRLHQEHLRTVSELGQSERLHDNFYRQRIVRAAK